MRAIYEFAAHYVYAVAVLLMLTAPLWSKLFTDDGGDQ